MAAKVDKADEAYWEAAIKPLVASHSNVEFVGEITDRDKGSFLGNATALLFPIDWPEPFGIVMIEAMACGTPTIAFRKGSAPEVIDEAASGFLVANVDEAVAAAKRVGELDRLQARRCFERRFAIERVARDYLTIYIGLTGVRNLLEAGDGPGKVSLPSKAAIDLPDRRAPTRFPVLRDRRIGPGGKNGHRRPTQTC